jgi:TRAP-type C4-dicarboxylate transport system substrate-binding protein
VTETFEYICAHDMRAENPLHRHLTALFSAVEDATNGRLKVDVVPWGQIGPSKVTLQKRRCQQVVLARGPDASSSLSASR